tara:strand:+ start:590 stop:1372 length:783 start_codon:yes stop_codon:yes gene_type:complete
MADEQSVQIEDPVVTDEPEVSAATLGVDQASFDKYHKEGQEFDWASYGKELAFKQQQAATAETPDAEETPAQTEVAAAVDAAGLDWDALQDKIQKTGKLDASDYEALRAAGIPDNVSMGYVDGIELGKQQFIDAVIDKVGGQESFNVLHETLFNNATQEQRDTIDVLLRDESTQDAGIALAYQYAGITPGPQAAPAPALAPLATSQGARAPLAAAEVAFASFDEQVQAQQDPRYRTNATYRASVERRIGSSTWSHNIRSH